MVNILFGIYGTLWRCVTPWLRRQKRFCVGFKNRLAPQGWPWHIACHLKNNPNCSAYITSINHQSLCPQGKIVWIQAASGGEAWLVHSLVLALQELLHQNSTLPKITILATTFTPQGLEVLQKIPSHGKNLRIHTAFFPLDHPKIMARAFAQINPACVVLLETELWPSLLREAKRRAVPLLVCNARMTEKSYKAYALLKGFWKKYAPTKVLATSEVDASRFAQLFGEVVAEMPNIKFDRAKLNSQQTSQNQQAKAIRRAMHLGESTPNKILLALSSVRQEEEPLLKPLLCTLAKNKGVQLIIAPRHQERIGAWQEMAKGLGLAFIKRSEILEQGQTMQVEKLQNLQQSETTHRRDMVEQSKLVGQPELAEQPKLEIQPELAKPCLLLWDTFGDLGQLYEIADLVFVGGSLAPLGGQNFLEALGAGLVPYTGSNLHNFLWAAEELHKQGLVKIVESTSLLVQALETEIAQKQNIDPALWEALNAKNKAQIRQDFAHWLEKRTGGSLQVAREILERVLDTHS